MNKKNDEEVVMRGLTLILQNNGFTTEEQQRDVLWLLNLANCFDSKQLAKDLAAAGYDKPAITSILHKVENKVFLEDGTDEPTEDDLTKSKRWLSIITKRIFVDNIEWQKKHADEINAIAARLSVARQMPRHKTYDAVIVLGDTQEELEAQHENAKNLLKTHEITADEIYVPKNPDAAKNIFANLADTLKNKYQKFSSTPYYKSVYLFAKTNRVLVISNAASLDDDRKEMNGFFAQNKTELPLSPEIICAEQPLPLTQELQKMARLFAVNIPPAHQTSSSYFSGMSNFASSIASAVALKMFARQSHTIDNNETASTRGNYFKKP